MSTPAPQPPLSVVLATAHPGAPLDALLSRLLPQLAGVGGELVFVDGSDDGLPAPSHDGVLVQHLRRPGDDVFSMRRAGSVAARGWVIAYSEDHCMPADDAWARSVVDAHRAHGHTAAVTGAVSNGTTRTLWDRASFLVTFATVLPPLPAPASRRVPPPANVSVKREVLEEYELTSGFLELELMPHLSRVGHIAAEPAVAMEHHQAHTARWFVVHHFHNGRTTGGLLHGSRGVTAVARRAAQGARLVASHVAETWRELRRRPGSARGDYAALPFVAALLAAHATGEIVGVAAGPGASPRHLE